MANGKKAKKRAKERAKIQAAKLAAGKTLNKAPATKKIASKVASTSTSRKKSTPKKTSSKSGGGNKSKIKELKAKLASGSLSDAEMQKIAKQIKKLGGKVNLDNFQPGGSKTGESVPSVTNPSVNLTPESQATLEEESQASAVAGDIANQDLTAGISIGDRLAPDVTDGEFLDRIDPAFNKAALDASLANFADQRERALTDSDEMKFALDSLKRRASEGFSLQEKEALQAETKAGINQQLQTGLRGAQAFNMGRNLRGNVSAAAFNPALMEATRARRGLENDIMLAELSEKARALTEFGGMTERRDQSRATNLLNIDNAVTGINQANDLLTTDINKFNAAQRAKEIAARTSKNAAGLGIVQDEKDTQAQNALLQESIAQSNKNLNELLSFA